MNLSNLARTATFRLSALYVSVFSISVLLLGLLVYVVTGAALVRQLRLGIQIETAALVDEYRLGGIGRLTASLKEREANSKWRGYRYRLVEPSGGLVAGTLPAVIGNKIGWETLSRPEAGDAAGADFTALTVGIDGGGRLTVAGRADTVRAVEKVILESFGWVLGATLLIGVAGGLFISSRFLDRIEEIGSTTRAIVAGNYRERMPVRGTNDDLDRLASTLNVMLDRIAGLMDSLRQVSNDIAHDLRTPLSRMRQRLEAALAMHLGNGELRESIARAISDTDDILATFSALLRIAQIEAGTRRSAFLSVDLSSLISDIAEAYAPSLQDDGRCLRCHVGRDVRLNGDRELLTQLVANLIENANRHTPRGTKVDVTLQMLPAGVLLVVADNGPGIPPESREKIFERFYRLERSRTTPGSGLGLSLVKSISDLHGATIHLADNEPGLRIEILFPAAPA